MHNMKKKTDRVWHVSFTCSNYYGSDTKRVIAQTAESAIEKVREVHEDAIFVSINHHGAIDI